MTATNTCEKSRKCLHGTSKKNSTKKLTAFGKKVSLVTRFLTSGWKKMFMLKTDGKTCTRHEQPDTVFGKAQHQSYEFPYVEILKLAEAIALLFQAKGLA